MRQFSDDERFKLIMENVRDFAIVTIDVDGRIADWNIGAERILYFKPEEIIGQFAEVIFTPEDRANRVPDRELATARLEGSSIDERWHVRRDESRFWGSGFVQAIRDEEGALQGYVKIFRDMTRQKKLMDSLKEHNRELEEFSAMASHDLRAPLYQISMLSELILKNCPEELRENILYIQKSSEKMKLLITNLIKVYKAVNDTDQPLEDVDLNRTVEAALSNLKGLIDRRKPALEIEKLPMVRAHEPQMTQLFQNLLDNAIKYSGNKNGTPRVKISGFQNQGIVEVRVEDNGEGFAPENAAAIFQPFKRLHGEEVEGTGLGLAICKKIVDRYQGEIVAQSVPGKGSLFIIRLSAAGVRILV